MLSTLQIINVHTWLAPSVLEQHRQHNKSGWCTFHYKQKIVLRISVYPRDKQKFLWEKSQNDPFISAHLYTGENQLLQGPQTGKRGGMVCSANTADVPIRVIGINNILSQPRGLPCQ